MKVQVPKPQQTTSQKRMKVLYPKKQEPVEQNTFKQRNPVRAPIKTETMQSPRATNQNTRPRPESVQNTKPKIAPTQSPRLSVQPPTRTNLRKNPVYTPTKIKESPKSYRPLYTIDEDDSSGTTYNIMNGDYDDEYDESTIDPKVIKMEYIENNSNVRNTEDEIKLYKCKFCPREFSTPDQLASHSKMHIQMKREYPCSVCSAAFMSKDLLDRHEKTHNEKGVFQCRSQEDLRFGNTSNRENGNFRILEEDDVLEDDIEIEEDTPTKKPTIIKMSYNDNTGSLGKMNPEAMTNVSKDMKIFKCNMCSQAFTRPMQLERHMNVHIKAKVEFECGTCFKVFPSKSTLDRHERIHTGEKPYQCRFCSKRFVQKEILKRHESIHLEIKTFKCDQDNCTKSFSQKKQLDKHISEIHLGIVVLTRFQCHLCTKVCVTVVFLYYNSYYLSVFRNSIMVLA